ncbi:MAG: MBL fold metallo-hydrolase [Myxococcota bacterium]
MTGFPLRWTIWLWIAIAGCSAPRYAESDHFDGDRFFNPTRIESPGLFALSRHILFGRDGEWPDDTRVPSAAPSLGMAKASEVAVTFVNHATLLLEFDGLTVLTDPVWSTRVGPFSWAGPRRAIEPGIPFEMLPAIDIVLISHNHYDHLDSPTVERLANEHAPVFLVPLGVRDWFQDLGIERVAEFDWWNGIELSPGSEVVFCPAQHNSGRSPFSNDETLWGSFLIRHGGGSVYFAGDTAYESHFREVSERLGPIDVALLPIGAYAPRETMRAFHMDPTDAVRAHMDLNARASVAMHFGTFQLTAEDFEAPPRELAHARAEAGIDSAAFVVLAEGETRAFPIGSSKRRPEHALRERDYSQR